MNDKIIFVAKARHRLAGWRAISDHFQRTVVCIHNPKDFSQYTREFSSCGHRLRLCLQGAA